MNYFDTLVEQSEIDKLDMHIFQNWATEQQVFPIALQTSECDTKLLQAPKTLKDLVRQHKQKGQRLEKSKNDANKKSFFNNIVMDIFLFIAAVCSMLATTAIIHLVCKHTKLKALVTEITFQPIKQTEALIDKENNTELYSTMVCNSSIDFNGHWSHNIYLYNHTKMYHI